MTKDGQMTNRSGRCHRTLTMKLAGHLLIGAMTKIAQCQTRDTTTFKHARRCN